jgi:hypothetical protein
MTEALRQRDAELAAAREQALRDERVLALAKRIWMLDSTLT